jgi:hypothetical protein
VAQTPPSGAGIPGGSGPGNTTVTPNLGTGTGNAGIPAPVTGTVGTGSTGTTSTTGSIGGSRGQSTVGSSAGASDPTAPPAGTPRIMVPERR